MTAFELAQRYIGIHELTNGDHPLIQWWLSLCGFPTDVKDEVPWCSAFVNGIAWELRLPRSKSAAARSWLGVGTPVDLRNAVVGYDIVVFSRGTNPAQGHVGFYGGLGLSTIHCLGGNQGDGVSLIEMPVSRLIGARRLV